MHGSMVPGRFAGRSAVCRMIFVVRAQSDNMPLSVDPKTRQSGGHIHGAEATCREICAFVWNHRSGHSLNYRGSPVWLICH
jgi:hypothetical protein